MQNRHLHRRFVQIVKSSLVGASLTLGALTLQGGGCYPEECGTLQPATDTLFVNSGNAELDRVVDEALAQLAVENPNATAEEKLLHLYYSSELLVEPPILATGQINEAVRLLLEEVSAEGEVPKLVCDAMCGTFSKDPQYNTFDSLEDCSTAQPADGMTYSDGALYCTGLRPLDCGGAGRRPKGLCDEGQTKGTLEGQWWAHISFLEQAAVHAFVQLADELRRLGAPVELAERCFEAAVDEIHHARMAGQLALARGVEPCAPEVVRQAPRSLFELALDNATEGCVRETFAGLEATWQSARATDGRIAEVMERIARDECGHAELSWDLHRWLMPQLSPAQQAEVEALQRETVGQLREELVQRSDLGLPQVGLPDRVQAERLLEAMVEELELAA